MLHTESPLAVISLPVWECVLAVPVEFAIFELTSVFVHPWFNTCD